MTFDQLMCFSVLAETLNYTKAAEILYISQPTMSRQIHLLEEEFHTNLFVRSYKSLRLSIAGEVFLEECRRILLAEKQLRERMSWFESGAKGALVCSSLGMYYPELQNVFRQFRKNNPDITLVMQQLDAGGVKESVSSGESDIGVCFSFEVTETDDFDVVPLFHEEFYLVVADTHPLANSTSISISDLQNERMILLGNNQFPLIEKLWNQLQISSSLHLASMNHPASLNTILLNIQAGNYVSLFPAPMTRTHLDGCTSLQIENFDSSFETVLIWKHDNTNPSLKLLLQCLYEAFPKNLQ